MVEKNHAARIFLSGFSGAFFVAVVPQTVKSLGTRRERNRVGKENENERTHRTLVSHVVTRSVFVVVVLLVPTMIVSSPRQFWEKYRMFTRTLRQI
jgi:hypothetical protein